jgi:hypothetical protein
VRSSRRRIGGGVMSFRIALACLTAAVGFACTWVPLSAPGEQVQLASPKFVEGCQQVGKTRATTKATILGFARGASTIRGELLSLARNDAAAMGGTHVSPIDDVLDGQQTYGVYVCAGGSGG